MAGRSPGKMTGILLVLLASALWGASGPLTNFEVKGIGSKLARRIDEDIEEQIRKKSGDFGIIQGDIRRILTNINRGISPEKILTSAIQGDDLGLTIPVRGRASTSETTFHTLKNTFSYQQKKLETCFEKMVSEDGLYTSYE